MVCRCCPDFACSLGIAGLGGPRAGAHGLSKSSNHADIPLANIASRYLANLAQTVAEDTEHARCCPRRGYGPLCHSFQQSPRLRGAFLLFLFPALSDSFCEQINSMGSVTMTMISFVLCGAPCQSLYLPYGLLVFSETVLYLPRRPPPSEKPRSTRDARLQTV